jgi:hypothetical protein
LFDEDLTIVSFRKDEKTEMKNLDEDGIESVITVVAAETTRI